jgi:hypothetical protein
VRGRENEECPRSFRGRTGTVVGYTGGSGCFVHFDDGFEEFTYAKTIWPESVEKITKPSIRSYRTLV